MQEQYLQNRHNVTDVSANGRKPHRGAPTPDELRVYYQAILRGLCRGDGDSYRTRTVAITSCCSGEGVTSVAANLALTAAFSTPGRVLLVDANLSNPSVEHAFGLPAAPGLTEIVLGGSSLQEVIQTSPRDNLAILTAGAVNGNVPQTYDAANGLADLVAATLDDFDLVVFDTPAATPTSAAFGLYQLLDAVVLVLEAERTTEYVAERTKNRLIQAGAHLVGVVINKKRHHVPNWLYDAL